MDPSKTEPKSWQEAVNAFVSGLGDRKGRREHLGRVPGVIVLDEPLFTDMDDPRFLTYLNGWVIARERKGASLKMWSLA